MAGGGAGGLPGRAERADGSRGAGFGLGGDWLLYRASERGSTALGVKWLEGASEIRQLSGRASESWGSLRPMRGGARGRCVLCPNL